jgi:hypothetical protein
MTAYKTARKLVPADAAYLAGLIDGEGTIALTRRHGKDERQLVISIASTERSIVEWALTTTGVGKITRKRTSKKHHAPSLTYSVSNRQALEILRQVTPCLRSSKRRRAELVLDKYLALTPRNGRYTEELAAKRAAFIADFLSIAAAG